MKLKGLTKTFIMISNWKKNPWFPWFAQISQRFKGWPLELLRRLY